MRIGFVSFFVSKLFINIVYVMKLFKQSAKVYIHRMLTNRRVVLYILNGVHFSESEYHFFVRYLCDILTILQTGIGVTFKPKIVCASKCVCVLVFISRQIFTNGNKRHHFKNNYLYCLNILCVMLCFILEYG